MPFSPQPQKKGKSSPQDGRKPSCGHTTKQKNCPVCGKEPAKVIDLPTEKKKIQALIEKISEKIADPKGTEKAATILSNWISRKR